MKKKKIIFFTILSSVIIITIFVAIWNSVQSGYDKQNKVIVTLKKIIPSSVGRWVINTVFYIPNLKNRNEFLELQIAKYDQGFNGRLFYSEKKITNDKKYNYSIKKYFLPFPSLDLSLGWRSKKNKLRAHYLEVIDRKIIVISGEGETIFFDKENIFKDQLNQKTIPNNLKEILKSRKKNLEAIRDLYYEDNYLYISVLESQNKKSFLNIYRAEKNFKNLNFEIFFESKEMIPFERNLQTGGRITGFLKNKILFSVGFFDKYRAAQDKESIFGKIIAIDKETKNYELISLGHRNPQGLFFSREKNIIFNTEHGPQGGDEVNINFLKDNGDKVSNFGWPIASYGNPYPQQDETFFKKNGYLKKSHKKNGFQEPLKYFTPSIGISELIYNNNKLYVSSLRAESVYIIQLSKNLQIEDSTRIKFDNRIRDIKFDDENNLFLVIFENTPSLGVLKIF